MNWTETPESSNIGRYRYNESTGILTVQFKRGATYNYYDVPQAVVSRFKSADSKGSFHAREIKGHFRYARV